MTIYGQKWYLGTGDLSTPRNADVDVDLRESPHHVGKFFENRVPGNVIDHQFRTLITIWSTAKLAKKPIHLSDIVYDKICTQGFGLLWLYQKFK